MIRGPCEGALAGAQRIGRRLVRVSRGREVVGGQLRSLFHNVGKILHERLGDQPMPWP